MKTKIVKDAEGGLTMTVPRNEVELFRFLLLYAKGRLDEEISMVKRCEATIW